MSREGEWGKWKAGRSKTQESTILRVTSYLCPTPQGWGVTGDGRAYLSVKTPPTVGFDVWNRTVEKLRGVVKCDVELGPDPRKVDTSGVSYAAWVSVADVSASKSLGARRLHQECRLRVL